MASIFTSSIQSHILSQLISKLPLHSIDVPQQSAFAFSGDKGPSLDLHDLQLDVEKLETQYFPSNAAFRVQNAFLKHLSIVISRNGIQINLSDMDISVYLKAGIESSQFLDPSSSIFMKSFEDPIESLEDMMGSVIGFVDAVSGVNSFMSNNAQNNFVKYEDEIIEENDQSGKNTPEKKEQDEVNNKKPVPKNTNSIVNYAMEYVLGKISVSITNFSIKITNDPKLMVKFDHITAGGDKVNRKCVIKGVSVLQYDDSQNTDCKETRTDAKFSSTNDNEEDFDDAVMSSSFMATSKLDVASSIMESAMYSTGRSVYMSAIGESYIENVQLSSNIHQPFFTVDTVEINLREKQLLKIDVGTIIISLKEVPKILSGFVNVLIQLGDQKSHSVPNSSTLPNKSSNIPVLEYFSLVSIEVNLGANTNEDSELNGEFVLILKDLLFERKSPRLIQGVLRSLQLNHDGTKLIYFDDRQINRPDIEVEIETNNTDYTCSLALLKSLHIEIPFDLFEVIMSYIKDLDPTWKKITELQTMNAKHKKIALVKEMRILRMREHAKSATPKPEQMNIKTTFNSFDINGNIHISKDSGTVISFECSPIINNTLSDTTTIKHITINIKTFYDPIVIILNKVRIVDHGSSPETFRDNDLDYFTATIRSTKKTVSIESIGVDSNYNSIRSFKTVIDNLKERLDSSDNDDKHIKFETTKALQVKRGNTKADKKLHSIYLIVLKFDINITKINEEFGDIISFFGPLKLVKDINGDTSIAICDISIKKSKDNVMEDLVAVTHHSHWNPPIFIHLHDKIDVFLERLKLKYSGKWLAMFDSPPKSKQNSTVSQENINVKGNNGVALEVYITITDLSLCLLPVSLKSAGVLNFKNLNTEILLYSNSSVVAQLTSDLANLYIIDDASHEKDYTQEMVSSTYDAKMYWIKKGYCNVGKVKNLFAKLKLSKGEIVSDDGKQRISSIIDLQIDLNRISLSMCSDSFQCFLQLLKDLKKPVSFSMDEKYKSKSNDLDILKDIETNFFDPATILLSGNTESIEAVANGEEPLVEDLEFFDDYYPNIEEGPKKQPKVKLENSKSSPEKDTSINVPISVHVSVYSLYLNLHDGYDWQETRTQIAKGLERVVEKANQIKEMDDQLLTVAATKAVDITIEDTLYDSIVIDFNSKNDRDQLYKKIISDLKKGSSNKIDSSFGKDASLLNRTPKNKVSISLNGIDVEFQLLSTDEPRPKEKPDVFSDTIDSEEAIDVFQVSISISNVDVIDNLTQSSWNKFLGYMMEAGEREIGRSMVQISVDSVRPIKTLAALEMILHIKLLPLRMHVDQDTLDFLTRFFEFKDPRFIPLNMDPEETFIQKLVIEAVKIKLDYKPKVVDYVGLRSGKTSEFANFFALDGSDITLHKVKLFGIPGFSKLNSLLTNQWSPDVKKNQLGGVLSGLAPVRSIYNIGSNINTFINIPVSEYRKDGRVIQGLQMGALSFTKATGGELLKLGAKLAAGTQTVLENTEEFLGGKGASVRNGKGDKLKVSSRTGSGARRRSSGTSFGEEDESDYHKYYRHQIASRPKNSSFLNEGLENECAISETEEDVDAGGLQENGHIISLYSNQPASLNEGFQVAFKSIRKNLAAASDAVQEASKKVSNAESGGEAFVEIARVAPIIVIRPVIAATEAFSKTLLGGVNELNPNEKAKADEKYKSFETASVSDSD